MAELMNDESDEHDTMVIETKEVDKYVLKKNTKIVRIKLNDKFVQQQTTYTETLDKHPLVAKY
jgi:hypothetical protein